MLTRTMPPPSPSFRFALVRSPVLAPAVMLAMLLIAWPAAARAETVPANASGGGSASAAVSPAERGSTRAAPEWRKLAGWEFYKAPTTTQFSLHTSFLGSRDELTGEPLDTWQGFLTLTAELELVRGTASIWGEIGYRGLASGTDAETTGLTDLLVGLKIKLVETGPLMLSIYGGPRIGVGDQSVSADFDQIQAGAAVSLLFGNVFGINAGLDASILWNLPGPDQRAFLGRIYVEAALMPLSALQLRAGLLGELRQNTATVEQFTAYLEGRVAFLFARVGVPFDFSDGANLDADVLLQGGVTFGF